MAANNAQTKNYPISESTIYRAPLLSEFTLYQTPLSDSVCPKDVDYLQNKFQRPIFDENTGLDNAGIKAGALELAKAMNGLARPIAKARAFEYVLDNLQYDVNEHDFFPGFGCYNRLDRPLGGVLNMWKAETYGKYMADCEERARLVNDTGALLLYPDFDHSVPDWDALYTLGFPGLRKRAADARAALEPVNEAQAAYFDAIEIEFAAIERLLNRLIAYAGAREGGNQRIKRESECLRALNERAPETTYEVLQLIYVYFFLSEHVGYLQVRSLGNLDRTLYPYVKRDIESGRATEGEIRRYLAYFMLQYAAINNYWGHPFYLGGTKADGESEINPLSYMILEEFDKLKITSPKIQLKINKNAPAEFMNLALNMIRAGNASLVFVCEPGVTRAMMGTGRTFEEARTCDINGCYEYNVRAKEVKTAPLYLNMLKPVELAFFDGVDPLTKTQLGPRTGDASGFVCFDEFYEAYIKQLSALIDEGVSIVDSFEGHLHEINPTPLFSSTIANSLKTARDAFSHGSVYNNTIMLHTGLATAADALIAVKRFVFDKRVIDMAGMRDALYNNWEGYEKLRLQILRDKEKFGNNRTEVDMYASAISRFAAAKVNLRPNARGGYYKAAMHSARTFVTFGEHTGATPDGRLAGDEMSKNLSPTMGMDYSGVTSLLSSVARIDSAQYPEDCNLDVMLHPATVAGEEGLRAMRALLSKYMDDYGISIHFNVFDPKVLEDAQAHPEKYRSLQVRVCGWNALFNNLSKKEQDAYILRAKRIAE